MERGDAEPNDSEDVERVGPARSMGRHRAAGIY